MTLHDVGFGFFVGEGDGGHHVSSQVDTEDGDSSEGKRNTEENVGEEGRDLGNVGGEGVGDGLLEVIKDETSLFYSDDDGSEVVIEEDHVSGLFRHIRSSDTHSNSNVGLLQSRRVVDSVSSHGDDFTLLLETFDDHQLLLGRGTSEDNLGVVADDFGKLFLAHLSKIGSVDDGSVSFAGVDLLNGLATADGNVLNGFSSLRDDSDRLGNSLKPSGKEYKTI